MQVEGCEGQRVEGRVEAGAEFGKGVAGVDQGVKDAVEWYSCAAAFFVPQLLRREIF